MDQSPRSSKSEVCSSKSDRPTSEQRLNGFERPYSCDQVVSWIGHLVSALWFFFGAIGILYLCSSKGSDDKEQICTTTFIMTIVAVGLHVVNTTVLIISWRSCETIDPAEPAEKSLPNGWCGVRLSGPRWEKTRYCALCRKSVPGLDHHCTWLQTCIGKSNYAQFFTVACTGTIQFLLQVVYAGLCLLWLHNHLLDDAGAFDYVVVGCLVTCFVTSFPCMLMYFVLLGFHLWLMILGYGTYEWMLRRRKEQRAKRAKTSTDSSNTQETTSPEIDIAVVKTCEMEAEVQVREVNVL
ncbi:putative palmitoyltransferase, DHHC domain-containing protein [Plasmopara halstedii]